MKLRHIKASCLFYLLSACAYPHPLYRALNGLGWPVKTEFLLHPIDQVELR
ncbi:MAG: hypothetical protein EOO61_11270 [Hymenobacter sp.]|nr:MAG: hypothetical protein EOO61_11270 [Hymenobacter sp.]